MIEQGSNSLANQLMPVHQHGEESVGDMRIYDPAMVARGDLQEEEIDLRVFWSVLKRYKWTILTVLGICMLVGLINTVIQRPVYRAQILLEVKPQSGTKVNFQTVEESDVPIWTLIGTQQNILVSDSIASGVIDSLELHDNPELNGLIQQRGLVRELNSIAWRVRGAISGFVTSKRSEQDSASQTVASAVDAPSADSIEAQNRIWKLASNLRVESVEDSLLLRVYYDSFDPVTAARIANGIATEYVKQNERRRFSATDGAKRHLESEIELVRRRLEDSESALTSFARNHEVVDIEDSGNIVTSRLDELSRNLTEAQGFRIKAQAEYERAKNVDPRTIPATQLSGAVQQLQNEYDKLQAQYVELSGIYKEDYPAFKQLNSKMREVSASLDREARKVVDVLENRYEQFVEEEKLIANELATQKSVLLDLKDRSVQYNILKREWETNKELYSGLLERMKELGIASGMELDNVSIIDKAAVPNHPFHPKFTRSILLAALIGLIFGISLALFLAYLDNSVDTIEKLERVAQVPSLGIVPKIEHENLEDGQTVDLISYQNQTNEMSEAFRSVRTSLMYSSPHGSPRSISVTSSVQSEGKSVTAVNLALVLAQSEARVLLVDADLRKSRLHSIFSIPSTPGLSEVLTGNVDPMPVRKTEIPTLDLMTAGKSPPNPAELLGSSRMDNFVSLVSDHYDVVIFDAPPVLGLADSVVLGTKVDGVLLVVSAQQVSQDSVRESVKRFRLVRVPIIGSILNQVTSDLSPYGYNGSYYFNYASAHKA